VQEDYDQGEEFDCDPEMMAATAKRLKKNWMKPMMHLMKAMMTQKRDTMLKSAMLMDSLARFRLKILMGSWKQIHSQRNWM